jgi:hypothetical protein
MVLLNPFFINHANAQFHKLRIQFSKCKEIEMDSFGCNISSRETQEVACLPQKLLLQTHNDVNEVVNRLFYQLPECYQIIQS